MAAGALLNGVAMYKHLDKFALLFVFVAGCALGVWGFQTCNYAQPSLYGDCKTGGWFDSLFKTMLLVRFGGEYSTAKDPLPLVAAQTIMQFFTILIVIKLFLAGIRRDVRVMLARRNHQHTIICGLGGTGMQIMQRILDGGRKGGWLTRHLQRPAHRMVVIEADANNPLAETCERQGVVVLTGDATQHAVLRMAGIARAKSTIICTGDDAANLDITLRVKEIAARMRRPDDGKLRVLMELRSDWFFSRLVDENGQNLSSDTADLRFFNSYDIAARLVMQKLNPPPDPYLDGGQFVVIGFGSMGREIVLSLLRSAPVPLGAKPRIVVFDRAAESLQESFLVAFPAATSLAELCFRNADFQPGGAEWFGRVAKEGGPIQAVFVCLPDDATSLNVGLELCRRFDAGAYGRPSIHVRLWRHRRLGGFLAELQSVANSGWLDSFGAAEEILHPDILFAEKLDRLAMACHEQYRHSLPPDRRGGPADVPWTALAEAYKASNRRKADHIRLMLARIGAAIVEQAAPAPLSFTPEEVDMLAQFEHRRWSADLILHGWTHGEARDRVQRRHECLLLWDKLPEKVRQQNRDEVQALPGLLAAAGFSVERAARLDLGGPTPPDLPDAHSIRTRTIVMVDPERADQRVAALRLAQSPLVSLWLTGRAAPQAWLHARPEDAAQMAELIQRASGWASPIASPELQVTAAA